MKLNNVVWGVAIASLGLGLGACGKKSSDSGTTDTSVTISGTLSASSYAAASVGAIHPASVDLSTFTMSCVTFSVPPTAGTGAIGSDGSFSVKIEGAQNSKFGCFILDASSDVVASMVFEDSSETDLNGDASSDSSVSLSGNANFGTVVLDLASGKATVDKTQISGTITAEDTSGSGYWGATGRWKFSSLGSSLPKGYSDICAADAPHDGPNACNGPSNGMVIYLRQVDGKKYANGATGTEPRYGLMIWENKTAFETCGSTLGTTFAELKANGVDFSADGINQGAFAFASSLTGSDTLTDGWKSSAATANYDIQTGCQNANLGSDRGWLCQDSSSNNYRMEFGAGCVNDTTGEPVRIDNWSGMTNCTNTNPTAKHEGFVVNQNVCDYTPSGGSQIRVRCSNEWAVSASTTFNSSTINNSLPFDWNNVAKISQGTSCATIANSGSSNLLKLAQLRCYADFYYQNSNNASGCIPEIRTNWSANTPEEFIRTKDIKPRAMFEANFYDIGSNGVGTFHGEHEDFRGVQAGENGWTNCRVREAITITMTPMDKSGTTVNNVQMEFATEDSLLDVDNKACVAWFQEERGATKKDLGNGIAIYVVRSRTLAKMTRQ